MKTIKYLIVLGMLVTVLTSYGQTHIWIQNNGDTNWSTPSNWSAGTVPNSTSEVLIPDGFEVEISTPSTANSIFLEGSAQLIVSNDLTLQDGLDITLVAQLNYRDGTIAGGIIENEGTINFENPELKLLSNITINNYNLMFFADSNIVRIGNGAVINNNETGIMEMLANGGLTREGTTAATLNNYGSIRKYTENGDFGSFYMIFDCNNFGTIEIAENNQFLFISPQASLTNNEDAILTGKGFFDITGAFSNQGTVAPGGDEIGTLTFVNTFSLDGGTLEIDINNENDHDIINVVGEADLHGDVTILSENQILTFDDFYTIDILTTSHGINTCTMPDQTFYETFDGVETWIITFDILCQPNTLQLEVIELLILDAISFETPSNAVVLYPNPVPQNGTVTLEASAEILSGEAINIVVYDVLGNAIEYTPTITGQSASFNMDHLASGLYFVQLRDEDLVLATRKLIVK